MNITKNKQVHRYREQTSGYQWGREQRGGTRRGLGGHRYPIVYIRIHCTAREYSQYCVGTINFKNCESLCRTSVIYVILHINYTSIKHEYNYKIPLLKYSSLVCGSVHVYIHGEKFCKDIPKVS